MAGRAGVDVGPVPGSVGGPVGLIPGGRVDPPAFFDFALAIAVIVLSRDVRSRAWRWVFWMVAVTLIALGFLGGVRA